MYYLNVFFCNLLIYVLLYCFGENQNEMKKKNNNIYFAALKNLPLNNPRNFNQYNLYEKKTKLSQPASILDDIMAAFYNINDKCANFI